MDLLAQKLAGPVQTQDRTLVEAALPSLEASDAGAQDRLAGRVVADTESQTSGWCSRIQAATVPLPTAVGPARTVSRGELIPG